MCDVDLPNIGKFPYPGNFPYTGFIQGFIHDLRLGLPYPEKYPYPGKSPYTIKASIQMSAYLSESNNN